MKKILRFIIFASITVSAHSAFAMSAIYDWIAENPDSVIQEIIITPVGGTGGTDPELIQPGSQSADVEVIEGEQTRSITKFETCKKITNENDYKIFIPTKTQSEWNSFLALENDSARRESAKVRFEACGPPPPGCTVPQVEIMVVISPNADCGPTFQCVGGYGGDAHSSVGVTLARYNSLFFRYTHLCQMKGAISWSGTANQLGAEHGGSGHTGYRTSSWNGTTWVLGDEACSGCNLLTGVFCCQ